MGSVNDRNRYEVLWLFVDTNFKRHQHNCLSVRYLDYYIINGMHSMQVHPPRRACYLTPRERGEVGLGARHYRPPAPESIIAMD